MLSGEELSSVPFMFRCYLIAAYASANGNSSSSYIQDVHVIW